MAEEQNNIALEIKEKELQEEIKKIGFFEKIREFFSVFFHNIRETIRGWFTPADKYNKDLHEVYSQNKKLETAILNNYAQQKEKTGFVKEGLENAKEELEPLNTNVEIIEEEVGNTDTPSISIGQEEELSADVLAALEEANEFNNVETNVEPVEINGIPIEVVEINVEEVEAEEIKLPEELFTNSNNFDFLDTSDIADTYQTSNNENSVLEDTEKSDATPSVSILNALNKKGNISFEYAFVGDRMCKDFVLANDPWYKNELVLCGTTKNPDSIILINVDEQGFVTNVSQIEGQRDVTQNYEDIYKSLEPNTKTVESEIQQYETYSKLVELGFENLNEVFAEQKENLQKLFSEKFANEKYSTYEELTSAISDLLDKQNYALQKDDVANGKLHCQISHLSEPIDYTFTFTKEDGSFEIKVNNNGEISDISDISQINDITVRNSIEALISNETQVSKYINTMTVEEREDIDADLLNLAASIGGIDYDDDYDSRNF